MAFELGRGFIIAILGAIIQAVSPTIRETVIEFVERLYDLAKQSNNKVDDVFVKLLADVLEVDVD